MEITINKHTTETISLELPKFYKHPTFSPNQEYTAILDEDTVVNVFHSSDLSLIKNCSPGYGHIGGVIGYEEVTEDEFMNFFQKVHKSISLSPIYKAGPDERYEALKNSLNY